MASARPGAIRARTRRSGQLCLGDFEGSNARRQRAGQATAARAAPRSPDRVRALKKPSRVAMGDRPAERPRPSARDGRLDAGAALRDTHGRDGGRQGQDAPTCARPAKTEQAAVGQSARGPHSSWRQDAGAGLSASRHADRRAARRRTRWARLQSGRPDSNQRPARRRSTIATRLRHAPWHVSLVPSRAEHVDPRLQACAEQRVAGAHGENAVARPPRPAGELAAVRLAL